VPEQPSWPGLLVWVAGLGVSGSAAAAALLEAGAQVVAVDARDDGSLDERADALARLGAQVRLGPAAVAPALPDGVDVVVASPGWRPDAPLLAAAEARGVPVWSEVELAWRLRPEGAGPWLTLTGTNGKTTTVRMLVAVLSAAGHRAVAAGNVGTPLVAAVRAEPAYDVVAVELSSFQLHRTRSVRPLASALLNVAPDHVDWHGSLAAYAADKGRVYDGTQRAAVHTLADPETGRLLAAAALAPGCARVGVTLGAPAPGQLGVVDDHLVDRAFGPDPDPVPLAAVADVRPSGPHNVANALAAAALARAYGVPADAVRAGLRGFVPDPHRIAAVGDVAGVHYVDDSKATNPHAAAASLAAFDPVVWVAGGLAKGATFDDLVRGAAGRLRAVVLLGRDRALIAEALARHAPEVPVVDVASTDTGVMAQVVRAAAAAAQPGDTVLLAPACASMDLFTDYGHRGDAFAAAVRALRDQ
jgi:UDP-N-acetylmuramoylalanine--D-glutamate ligase